MVKCFHEKREKLPNDIDSLKKLIIQLFEENARLKAEIDQLKAENAAFRRRLGMDSHNSHKPPSSDGYKKKIVKPGLPKEQKKPEGWAAKASRYSCSTIN